MTINVRDKADERRYEAWVGDQLVAFAASKVTDGRIALTRTETAPAFRGRGVARAVVEQAPDSARERQLAVLPLLLRPEGDRRQS